MDELLQGLKDKVGLSEAKARQVVAFLKENASKVPSWLQSGKAAGIAEKIPGLGGSRGK